MKQVVFDPLQTSGWSVIDRKASRLKKMQRGVLTAARLFQGEGGGRFDAWMVTCTYRPSEHYSPRHITGAVRAMREWCKDRGLTFRYVWVLEQHKSGKIHYHVCIWLPKGVRCPQWDRKGFWSHGMTNTILAQFAPGYLAKYVSKGVTAFGTDDPVPTPKGARLHGRGGLSDVSLVEWRFWLAPKWAREAAKWGSDLKRVAGGYVCRVTAEFFATPYEVRVVRGIAMARLKVPLTLSLVTI